MLLGLARFRVGGFRFHLPLLAVVALAFVVSSGRAGLVVALDPIDVEGPADASPAEKSTKPEDLAQPDKPTQTKKTTKAESKVASPKKEAAKPHDEKKSGTAEKAENKSAETKSGNDKFGEPLALGMVKLLQDEIRAGIARRGVNDRFARFQGYAINKLNVSAGRYTGSELAGNCRLRWYDRMMRNVVAAPAEAERFTRELHTFARDDQEGLVKILAVAATKLDYGNRKPRKLVPPTSPEQAVDALKQALTQAQVSYCAALAPLSKSEIQELETHLVPVLCTQNQVGHTVNDRGTARRLCDLMENMDRGSMLAAADALAIVADRRFLEQLKALPDNGNVSVRGVTGKVAKRIDTPAGAIIIGGKGANTYQLDQMRDVAAVIDLGSGNTYHEGTVGRDRPVLVVVNLGGNNVFRGQQAGIQGGAVLGVSMLVNVGGSNTYEAQDVAQGSALAGVGILVDFGPNNRYRGVRRLQGQAIGGVGILIGHGGKNDYHAALWAQGFGGPLGFGLLDNTVGNNHYYCGGMWRDSYPETPGCEGWGQGVGAGLRAVADGGIGVILDNGGENTYEFDYLSHGGGYWCGLGFARDFGGNTKRLITKTAYNGGPRNEPNFQRFGCGWGCHYSLGFLFDDSGDDLYEGTIMGTGMAWDCSMGVLCDLAGNDHYTATGGLTQGTGAQMGLGILFDYKGDDDYEGYGQGYATPGISYHTLPDCGGNFSFLVDYGGKDKYGCGADNNDYIQRGDTGGFLIDRPARGEIDATTAAVPQSRAKSGS